MNTRKLLFIPTGAIAVVLALASVAVACTVVRGQATITGVTHTTPASAAACADEEAAGTDCAAPGDVITVEGSHTAKNRLFNLHFLNYASTQDTMGICMGTAGEQIIGGPVQSDSRGNIPATTGVIPAAGPSSSTSTPKGPALVCFITPGYGVGTQEDALDIVVI